MLQEGGARGSGSEFDPFNRTFNRSGTVVQSPSPRIFNHGDTPYFHRKAGRKLESEFQEADSGVFHGAEAERLALVGQDLV